MLALRLLLVTSLLFTQPAAAQSWKDWSNLKALRSGASLKIQLKQKGGTVKGTLVKLDDAGIEVRLKSGAAKTVTRTEVRRVLAWDGARRYTPLIGTAAGAATLGAISAQERFDFTPTGVLLFTGIGALIGFGMGRAFRSTLFYEAP